LIDCAKEFKVIVYWIFGVGGESLKSLEIKGVIFILGLERKSFGVLIILG
jgi:hypothetical protein